MENANFIDLLLRLGLGKVGLVRLDKFLQLSFNSYKFTFSACGEVHVICPVTSSIRIRPISTSAGQIAKVCFFSVIGHITTAFKQSCRKNSRKIV